MILRAVIHGLALAIPLIMPLGAQNIFVFNQGARQARFLQALPVVITAGICDTILITLAVTGVSVIVLTSVWLKSLLLGIGTVFLVYIGWLTWHSNPAIQREDTVTTLSAGKQVLFAVSVSLFNPHAIVDTIGVIGTNSLYYSGEAKLAFTLATISVSWVWFFLLAVSGKVTGRLDQSGRVLRVVNKFSAVVMWTVAVYLVRSLF